MRYRFTANYRSHFGTYAKGDEIELDDPDLAAWLARDSGGTVEPIPDEPATRAVEKPPADRMARRRNDRARKAGATDG